jgi:hypothetical protein
MKALPIIAAAVALTLGSAAHAKPCVNVQANVQNKANNTRTTNQNCDTNISGNIQAGKNNSNDTTQTGGRNVSRSHQIGSESNTSSTVQKGRINDEKTTQRGRR